MATRLFLHQTDQVAVGVEKKSDPQIVVGHLGGHLRGPLGARAAADDVVVGRLDALGLEIRDRIHPHPPPAPCGVESMIRSEPSVRKAKWEPAAKRNRSPSTSR